MPDEFGDIYKLCEDYPRSSVDKDGNEIFYGECAGCGEVTHHKVKDVTDRKMKAGEVYFYVHPKCRDKFIRIMDEMDRENNGDLEDEE